MDETTEPPALGAVEDDVFAADCALVVSIPTDDDSVARRVRAVAATRPIHDLDRNKASWDGDFWDRYDLLSLALALIDQVALSMGISNGILHEAAVSFVSDQARRQRPDGTREEWAAVGQRVVTALVSDAEHEVVWVDHRSDRPIRRRFTYRLLYEQWNADETIHLRASETAINVLISALDLDIESAQVAAEAQIRVLIERGAFESAVAIASQARLRSAQYLERVRSIIRDTLIDPDSWDWAEEVPQLLASALDHVEDRIRTEIALEGAVSEGRDAVTGPEARQHVNQLMEMLRDCSSRHMALQRHLIEARGQFRKAQDDKFVHGRGTIRRAVIEDDLINPFAAAGVVASAPIGEDLLVRFAAPRRLYWPTGAVLMDELLAPPAPPERGEEVPEPEFAAYEPPWWEPYWDAAEAIVDDVRDSTTLSVLLDRAASVAAGDEDLDENALAGVVCHLAHALVTTPISDADDGPLTVAAPTGVRVARLGVESDDLWIAAASSGGAP